MSQLFMVLVGTDPRGLSSVLDSPDSNCIIFSTNEIVTKNVVLGPQLGLDGPNNLLSLATPLIVRRVHCGWAKRNLNTVKKQSL